MRLSNVREAACIRASTLLNQANPKKGFKAIQPEIQSVSAKIKFIYISKIPLNFMINRCQKFSE
jgi:hypothetical protein